MNKRSKVSIETIRRANKAVVMKGLEPTKKRYNGVITATTRTNGIYKTVVLTKASINNAYEKSLREYAEKL